MFSRFFYRLIPQTSTPKGQSHSLHCILRFVGHEVGVYVECELHGGMPSQILDSLYIGTSHNQLCNIGVPELVRRNVEIERNRHFVLWDLITQLQTVPHRADPDDVPHLAEAGGRHGTACLIADHIGTGREPLVFVLQPTGLQILEAFL